VIHRPLIERYRGGALCFRFISIDDLARERERAGANADYDVYIGSHRKKLEARLNYDTLERVASITLLKIATCTVSCDGKYSVKMYFGAGATIR